MTGASLHSTCAQVATRLDTLLNDMAGQLEIANSPQLVALKSLGLTTYGGTQRAYTDEALRVWTALRKQYPEDVEVLHHLAIMHHARAFDLEAGPDPSKANADWELALDCWYRLWQSEGFWRQLAGRLQPGPHQGVIVDEVRAGWPVSLLDVHFRIALDSDLKKRQRIAYHVELALKSPFPAEAKNQVRQRAYDRWVRAADPRAWQNDMLSPEILTPAREIIEQYLTRDPGCLCALEDLLRLEDRLLRAWHHELGSLSDGNPERERMIGKIADEGRRWGPYFAQLLEQLEQLPPQESASDIREKLRDWCHTMGLAHTAGKQYAEAVQYLDAARRAAEDEEGRLREEVEIGEVLALEAREQALSNDPAEEARAKAMADRVGGRSHLSVQAYGLLANAYTLVREFDLAEQACQKGLDWEPANLTDFDAVEQAEKHKQVLHDLLGQIGGQRRRHEAKRLVEEATAHLKDHRYEEARERLDRVVALEPQEAGAYFLRCQCHLALVHPRQAQQDLEAFRRHLKDGDAEARQALGRLDRECKELVAEAAQFGEDGLRWRRQAAIAFRDDCYAAAEAHLRRAIPNCPSAGKTVLVKELAAVLASWAGHEFHRVMKGGSASDAEKRATCAQALAHLEEAVRLDPADVDMRQNLEALRQINGNLDTTMRMERELGGHEAFELRQKAVVAFNADRHKEAIDLLRKAITVSGNRGPLEKELSMVLAGAAVSFVNEEGPSGSRTKLQEAKRMLEEAVELDPENQNALRNLMILRQMLLGR